MSKQQSLQDRSEMELHYDCVTFYNREAELLDDKELEAWLDLLTEDISYTMPVRLIRERGAERAPFSEQGYNYHEDRSTLEARVKRFQSEYAWSEDPPSRTRHFVSNVRIDAVDDDEIAVKNNLLLFRAQRENDDVLLSAERHDVLRQNGETLQLSEREIRLDHNVIPMKNISVFF